LGVLHPSKQRVELAIGRWGQTRGLAPVVVDQCSESRAPDSFPKLSFERILPLQP
jgi:hypothetical protein